MADGVVRVNEASRRWSSAHWVSRVGLAVVGAAEAGGVQLARSGSTVGVQGVGIAEARASTSSGVNLTFVEALEVCGVGLAEVGAAASSRLSDTKLDGIAWHTHELDELVMNVVAVTSNLISGEVEKSITAHVSPLSLTVRVLE